MIIFSLITKFVQLLLNFASPFSKSFMNPSMGIIGGADGKTSVFVTTHATDFLCEIFLVELIKAATVFFTVWTVISILLTVLIVRYMINKNKNADK